MQQALDYFNQLNQDYLRVHQTKEELFWQQYMGTGADDVSARFTAAESAYKRFIGEPRRLAKIRQLLAQLENQAPSEALRRAYFCVFSACRAFLLRSVSCFRFWTPRRRASRCASCSTA